MPAIAWLNDIHLDFIDPDKRRDFFRRVADTESDAVVIAGDIGEAHSVVDHLRGLAETVARPVCFVLGNHDFYTGSVSAVRDRIGSLCAAEPRLIYLSQSEGFAISDRTVVMGHDGWADGQFGNYDRSDVILNDYLLIEEFRPKERGKGEPVLSKSERLFIMNRLAQDAAAHLNRVLPAAAADRDHILAVTHVPPFREACWFAGQISDDNYLPHFSSRTVGESLRTFMQAHPDKRMTVVCGHTHLGGEARILDNLTVLTGAARYSYPRLQRLIEVP